MAARHRDKDDLAYPPGHHPHGRDSIASEASEVSSDGGDHHQAVGSSFANSYTHGSVNWDAFESGRPSRPAEAFEIEEYIAEVADEVGAHGRKNKPFIRSSRGASAELSWWKKLSIGLGAQTLILIIVFFIITRMIAGRLEDTSLNLPKGVDLGGRAYEAARLTGLRRIFRDMDMDHSGAVNFADFFKYLNSDDRLPSRGFLLAVLSFEDGDAPLMIPDEPASKRKPLSLHHREDMECKSLGPEQCAEHSNCFPHFPGDPGWLEKGGIRQAQISTGVECWGSQQVECFQSDPASSGYPDIAKKMLLTSDGLSNNDLRNALRHLVLHLPEDVVGKDRLERANARSIVQVGSGGFKEPDLYRDLRVLILYDGCGFKQHNLKRRGDDAEWQCEDFKTGLDVLGFDPKNVRTFHMLDLSDGHHTFLQSQGDEDRFKQYDALRKELFMLQDEADIDNPMYKPEIKGKVVDYVKKYHVQQAIEAIKNADIIAANGGNVDWFTFLMTKVSDEFLQTLREKLQGDRAIWLSQSAGSIAAMADIGISVQPAPNIGDNLMQCMKERNLKNMMGLELMSRCAVRPHFEKSWSAAADVYERAKGIRVLRMPNGEGMMCLNGLCKMVGMTHECKYYFKERDTYCKRYSGHAPHQESVVLTYTGGRTRARQRRFSCNKGELVEKYL